MGRGKVVFAVVCLVAATLAAGTGAWAQEFTDIAGTTHEESIVAVADAGVAGGYPDGTFRPDESVTRGQMATFLMRALDLPEGDPTVFSDVVGTTHETAIGAVAGAGIAAGYPDGTFRPDEPVSRGAMATFLTAGFDLPDDDTLRFTDVEGTTHEQSIGAVAGAGIAGGFDDGTFRPAADVTRGQMATFLARALGLVGLIDPPTLPEEPDVPLAPDGTTFGDGLHTDLEPGTYRAAPSSGCYWERLSGLSGEFDDIIANEFTDDPTIVTIASTDAAFSSDGCGTWQAVQDTYPSTPATEFTDGAHVVGGHIAAGTYRTGASDGCYWERRSGFSGEFDDIIANQITDNQTAVTIESGDVGFLSSSCGTWIRDD